MIQIKRILVPVDFSEPSKKAVNYGLSLASQFDAELLLANVVPFNQELYEKAQVKLFELIPGDLWQRLDCETIVKAGDVRDEILGIVNDRQVDLVVMGSHGRGYFQRMVLGSVTERMLRKLPVPVLTVSHLDDAHVIHKPGVVPLKRILYASDLGGDCDMGLQFAVRLAHGLDAHLTVVHVIDPMGTGFLSDQTVGYMPDYAASIRAQSEEYLNRFVTVQTDGSVPITTVLGEGTPSVVINEVAAESNSDLIVINLHGKAAIERALLGSTAERVIRTAALPVLALPLPATYASRWVAA
jgi:nucleotide-binding universal stress UspA family protein